jgi:serine/threonine protein kinase
LVRLLGKGMFGKVYVAQRVDVPEHQVALKVVPREVYSGRNVERELVMLAAASHPNIVQLKDHGMTESYVWLTMPVYEGETLADRLRRGPLSFREAHEIFLPIARALHALHSAGMRHQDIKPENIFLAAFVGHLHPILLDLGVAAEREATFVAGTILYASPEQLAAFSKTAEPLPLSEKMDTYCLAATLLLSLVGPRFYPGEGAESRAQIALAQDIRARLPLSYEALPDLKGGPREQLADSFRRWLDPNPDTRPYVSEMADELDVLLEPEREEDRIAARGLSRQKTVRRVTFAALVVGAVGGALVVYSKRETLKLASELNRARAEGAASFDKLDTCVASHRLAQREAQSCKDQRAKEEREFKASLENLAKSGGATVAEHAHELATLQASFTAKLKTCEDDANRAATACVTDKERASSDQEKKVAVLSAERDEQRKVAEARNAEVDHCRSELASCEQRLSAEKSAAQAPTPKAQGASAPTSAAPSGASHPALPAPNPAGSSLTE